MMKGLLVLLALVCASGTSEPDDASRPVAKVVALLKDMLKQLETEGEEDEAVYDKLACWCETNDKEKTKAINEAEAAIEAATTFVEGSTQNSARLVQEVKNLKKEIADNQDALDKATAIRAKELAEFNAEEKDLLGSISALKSAVTVLAKHQSLSQMPRSHAVGIAASLQQQLQRHEKILKASLTPTDRKKIASFVQETFAQKYAPQSGEIFGILSQMKETFESNLALAQKDEAANLAAYEELKAAKQAEIDAASASADTKSQELADTDQNNAQAKQTIEDTSKTMAADKEFLAMLKEKCAMTDSEWEERQKTRQLEMEACSKALAFLNSDDAHDLFAKTFDFVQTESQSKSRDEAAKVLAEAARALHKPQLATLAVRVRLDAFKRVKKAIDDMVAELLAEQADEVKQKDYCVDEFNTNKQQTNQKDHEKKTLITLIGDLEDKIQTLADEIAAHKAAVAEMQLQLKRAGENRERENKEFLKTISEQRATQQLLKKALDVLANFYAKKTFLQTGQAPPPGFKEYKNNANGGGVMGMIKEIIADAKQAEADATHDETNAQAAYEDVVKDTNRSIDDNNRQIVEKTDVKAKTEQELVQAKEDRDNVLLTLEQLNNYKGQLHKSCDFVLKNFEIRQTARSEEVEALRQAKQILSGAKFNEFLQQ